jgi:hypothetical protein
MSDHKCSHPRWQPLKSFRLLIKGRGKSNLPESLEPPGEVTTNVVRSRVYTKDTLKIQGVYLSYR